MRRAPVVEIAPHIRPERACIRHDDSWTVEPFVLTEDDPLAETLNVIARSTSGRALAHYAFARGANAVVHDYDLKLDEG